MRCERRLHRLFSTGVYSLSTKGYELASSCEWDLQHDKIVNSGLSISLKLPSMDLQCTRHLLQVDGAHEARGQDIDFSHSSIKAGTRGSQL